MSLFIHTLFDRKDMIESNSQYLRMVFRGLGRAILGITFIFSGLLKGLDPYGLSLKIDEYLQVYGIGHSSACADILSIFLCGLEMLLGSMLLLGLMKPFPILGILSMLSFFTVLTALSTFIPQYRIEECGCFGNLFPMSSEKSLFKNGVLIVIAALYLFSERNITCANCNNFLLEAFTLVLVASISFGIPVYGTLQQSILDTGGYKIGVDVKSMPTFRIVDNQYRDITDTVTKASNSIILVQKQSFTTEERKRVSHISHNKGPLVVLRYEACDTIPGLPNYVSNPNLLKSLIRSRHNAVIEMSNGTIQKKKLLHGY